MKAITITKFGGPEVLELRDYPDKAPGAGEVQVDVKAAGLNFAEIAARQGLYPDCPPPPVVVGYEAAGVVNVGSTHISQSAGKSGNFSMHCTGTVNFLPPSTIVIDNNDSSVVGPEATSCLGSDLAGTLYFTEDWHLVITKR